MKNYTAEQLQENYNKFIQFVKKVFTNNPERLEKLLHMYSQDELGKELIFAPASGKLHYHSAYVGGYIDHIMNVCRNAFSMKKMFAEQGGRINFTDEELFFSALHHDLGKLGDGVNPYYIPEQSEWHRKNQNSVFKQNGELYYMDVTDRALWLLNQYGIKYSPNEMLGIKLADGLYNEATKKYFINYGEGGELKTELPYLIHWADHMSCRVESGEYKTFEEEKKNAKY
jgi:hypothetical protein